MQGSSKEMEIEVVGAENGDEGDENEGKRIKVV
jgi:hypothetical protein